MTIVRLIEIKNCIKDLGIHFESKWRMVKHKGISAV